MYSESVVEEAVLEWFHELNYDVPHGPDIDLESDVQEKATKTVLEQAELMAEELAA